MELIKSNVDGLSSETDKHPLAPGGDNIATNLKDMLFNCRQQDGNDCQGKKAYEELMEIAKTTLPEQKPGNTVNERVAGTASPDTSNGENPTDSKAEARGDQSPSQPRIEVSFRDNYNNIYYLPLHLLREDNKPRLADLVQIEQPLPIPFRSSNATGCIKEFAVGLVVKDGSVLDDEQWRKQWEDKWLDWKKKNQRSSNFYSDIGTLKTGFFHSYIPGINPGVGLILLSHHGGGVIADTDKQTAMKYLISSDDITRGFGAGSFAILASCSVGAMDEKHRDNSLILHSLNKKGVSAAIISLFNVPPEVAKPFIGALQNTVLTLKEDTTLFEMFKTTKEKYCESVKKDNQNYLIPKIDFFMLVGDGDVKICKSTE